MSRYGSRGELLDVPGRVHRRPRGPDRPAVRLAVQRHR
jgi:hypothetical protein